jgi:hypothetical protein
MAILKTSRDTFEEDQDNFIGLYVDDSLDQQLTLLSLVEGVSKSLLLRAKMKEWLSAKDLITQLAQRLFDLRKIKGESWSRISLAQYKSNCRYELERKLPEEIVDEIFKKFDSIFNDNL